MSGAEVKVMKKGTLTRLKNAGKGYCRECKDPFKVYMKYVTKRQMGINTPPLCHPCAKR